MNFAKTSIAALMFVALIASGSFAATCTNASLKGVYGSVGSGLNGSGEPAAGVSQITSDGNGNLTGTTTKSVDGTIGTFSTTGTYSIAKNCTGTGTLTNQDDQSENSNIILNNGNKGAFMIQTDPNHTVSSVAYAQGTATCTNLGVKHTYSFEATGFYTSVGQIAAAGQFVLNGAGKLTGTATFSLDGSISTLPVTGTYQINSNCTGTLTFTPQGESAVNLGVVIVNGGKEMMFIETDANTILSGTLQE
ncbi:MAG: hypothetical protein ABSG02_21305 [Terriglobales bacterium]|jgi:hypothetical protein